MTPYSWTLEAARTWATERGLPAFRGQQLFEALYRGQPERFADIAGLPKELRAELDAAGPLVPAQEVVGQHSQDGTRKSLLAFSDNKRAECVSIPTSDRHTICVSSQVGCAVGCTFCASGLNGVDRSLTADEIVYQIVHHHRRRPVTNVVFMGSGEPLFNYDTVLETIRILAEPRGLGMGRRRFTVSTSGVPDRIRQLGRDEPQVTLALSLHAPDDATRSRLVPLNRRWPIAELMAAMDDYSRMVNRRITLEYVLLRDANMRDDQARDLAGLARRYGAHINLIPFNPVTDTPHQRPSWDEIDRFASLVDAAGGSLTVRGQRGADIDAACGQLARKHEGPA
ncbi:MAG: 23S rRNA (adenine(2503)-C(2))-methyltransferase RlmN [Planctomycetota bacterium]|jgi:23S rRNA (adenine2503-C2)-methyltransferase|nr:23S rRNA (adenine(2503)-C(2))-methyltransferase RlmN [Planctomycetota bacterium]